MEGIYKNVQTIQKRKKQNNPPAPLSSSPTTTTNTTTTKPLSSNEKNINVWKVLKIALPVLIGLIAVLGISRLINPTVGDDTIQDPVSTATNQVSTSTAQIQANTDGDAAKKLNPPAPNIPTGTVYVKGGTFTMGCTSEQGSDCGSNESPTHTVTLSDFYMGEHEVTVKQYMEFCTATGSNYPAWLESGSGYHVKPVAMIIIKRWDIVEAVVTYCP